MQETVRVYFDFLCPYAWRGAEVANIVQRATGDVEFEWHHYSLMQARKGEDGQQLWNEPLLEDDEYGTDGLLPFLASCAARRQGPHLHFAFMLELLRARHRDHKPYTRETIMEVARSVGAHMACFEDDLADPECRTQLAQDHYRAVNAGVFGTPTFSFESGDIAYLRLKELPEGEEEAVRLFMGYKEMLSSFPYLETIRRPRPQGN